MSMKIYERPPFNPDPPDLEQRWIEEGTAFVKAAKKIPAYESEIESRRMGLRSYAKAGNVKAINLMNELAELTPRKK